MKKIIFLSLFLFTSLVLESSAQQARVLDLDNANAYSLIERFIQSGKFETLNPTKLPYKESEIYEELKKLEFDSLTAI